jgi:hypothetical protein
MRPICLSGSSTQRARFPALAVRRGVEQCAGAELRQTGASYKYEVDVLVERPTPKGGYRMSNCSQRMRLCGTPRSR